MGHGPTASRLATLSPHGTFSAVSTVEEIESAIETLPPEQVREVLEWLQTHESLLGQESEEALRHEVLIGFDQLQKGQTVTVTSKEAFIALLREDG
jgi:hypothetical protein